MPTEAPATPKPSRLPLLLALVNLLATGATAGLVVVMRPHASDADASSAADDERPAAPPVPAALDPFLVNLDEPGDPRYLKAKVELELHGDESLADFEARKLAVRDTVLSYLSGLSVEMTRGAEGKEKIRTDLFARVEDALGEGKLAQLYLSEFVIQ